MTLPLSLRPMREGDVAYVVSTWAQSLDAPYWMARDAYRSNMRRSASAIIGHAARVVVLCSSDHESTILGWACGDDGVVHYAYVRPALRSGAAGRAWVEKLIAAARGDRCAK